MSRDSRDAEHIFPPLPGFDATGVEMLISRMTKKLLVPSQSTRRRRKWNTFHLQDLEPRLFLSVNSLLASDLSADQDADATAVEFESASVDTAQVEATVEASPAIETGGASGYSSGTGMMFSDPQFSNAYAGINEFGIFAGGTVEWEGSPFPISGMTIKIYNYSTSNLVGMAYTDSNGDFFMGNTGAGIMLLELLDPISGSVVDTQIVTI